MPTHSYAVMRNKERTKPRNASSTSFRDGESGELSLLGFGDRVVVWLTRGEQRAFGEMRRRSEDVRF